jgi:hypothetical protein
MYLDRQIPPTIDSRLEKVLKQKAQQGVRIYIILWKETDIAIKVILS